MHLRLEIGENFDYIQRSNTRESADDYMQMSHHSPPRTKESKEEEKSRNQNESFMT